MRKSVEDRFWEKVSRSDGCWIWGAYTLPGGYGQFGYKGRLWMAHRVAYDLVVGPIPDGFEIDHICRVRNCVRPDHLRAVTHKQNMENVVAHVGTSSGVRGVYWDRSISMWRARVGHNGRFRYVGCYKTLPDASSAVLAARMRIFSHNDTDKPE